MTTFSLSKCPPSSFNSNKLFNSMLFFPSPETNNKANIVTPFSLCVPTEIPEPSSSNSSTPIPTEKANFNDSPLRNCLTQELMKSIEECSPNDNTKTNPIKNKCMNVSSFGKEYQKPIAFNSNQIKGRQIFTEGNPSHQLQNWNYQLHYIDYSMSTIYPKSILFPNQNGNKDELKKKKNKKVKKTQKKVVINSSVIAKKDKKKKIEERDGDWNCYKCKNLNFAFRTRCNRCNTDKKETDKYFEIRGQKILNMLGSSDNMNEV